MPAIVYYASMRSSLRLNLLGKIDRLLAKMGLPETLQKHHLVAVKTHFGEAGNTAFVRPVYIRQVVQNVLKTGAKAFVTDSSTLYRGSRGDAISHLLTAHHNGFTYSTVGAPLVIADGLRSQAAIEVPIDGEHYRTVPVADAIAMSDAMVVVSHFKLHEATGFGGAIKNLGMGCSPRAGKLSMHSSVSPVVLKDKCTGDAICVRACTFDAITLVDNIAVIDEEKCTGCAECMGVCPHQAIVNKWDAGGDILQERMAEHAYAAVKGKQERCFYINFILRVSPACDCYGMNDSPIVPDLGIYASTDPVALDTACVDALKQAHGLPDSALKKAMKPGSDKIADVYPEVRYTIQLSHAEKIGLGSRIYQVEPIG